VRSLTREIPLDCYQYQLSSLEARNLRRGFSNHS
jgi:hypothetical protein